MHSRETDALTARIIVALTDILYLPAGSITVATRIADLGLDSLDMVEAGLELEATLGCAPADTQLAQASTIGEVVDGLVGAPSRPLRLAALALAA